MIDPQAKAQVTWTVLVSIYVLNLLINLRTNMKVLNVNVGMTLARNASYTLSRGEAGQEGQPKQALL
jgi:hypothetical protein